VRLPLTADDDDADEAQQREGIAALIRISRTQRVDNAVMTPS
jgi:hypothetical protein